MAWELESKKPLHGLKEMESEMDRLWDTFLFGRPKKVKAKEEGEWFPAVDITETDEGIVVSAEIPGMNSKDIDISLSEGVLIIQGERKFAKETSEETYIQIERSYGTFRRTFTIPRTIDQEKIKASYKDGVLRVVLPKKEKIHPKQISVET